MTPLRTWTAPEIQTIVRAVRDRFVAGDPVVMKDRDRFGYLAGVMDGCEACDRAFPAPEEKPT